MSPIIIKTSGRGFPQGPIDWISGVPIINLEEAPVVDLEVLVFSGVHFLSDGTIGGTALPNIRYGLNASNTLINWTPDYRAVGLSLQKMMAEFPDYSKISNDRSSIGSQFLSSFSRSLDQIFQESQIYLGSFDIFHAITRNDGTIYAWDFSTVGDINHLTSVSGKLGTYKFNLPLAKNEYEFINWPPTRFETTNCVLSGWDVHYDYVVQSRGLNTICSDKVMNCFTRIMLEVILLQNTLSIYSAPAYFEINGTTVNHNADDGYQTETIYVTSDGLYGSRYPWKYINYIKCFGLDPNSHINVKFFNFNPRFRFDVNSQYFLENKTGFSQPIVWQIATDDTTFESLVQTELDKTLTGQNTWLVRGYPNSDTFEDISLEFQITDVWQLKTSGGNAITNIVDFTQIPGSPFLLLLHQRSGIYVVDTCLPIESYDGYISTPNAPASIDINIPFQSDSTVSNFQIDITAQITSPYSVIERYRWLVHRDNSVYILDTSGVESPFYVSSGWTSNSLQYAPISDITYPITTPGSYMFELEIVDNDANQYHIFKGYRVSEKTAMGPLPIYGVSGSLVGIDLDIYNRAWITNGIQAARLIKHVDVGIWDVDNKTLFTKEKYDDVIL